MIKSKISTLMMLTILGAQIITSPVAIAIEKPNSVVREESTITTEAHTYLGVDGKSQGTSTITYPREMKVGVESVITIKYIFDPASAQDAWGNFQGEQMTIGDNSDAKFTTLTGFPRGDATVKSDKKVAFIDLLYAEDGTKEYKMAVMPNSAGVFEFKGSLNYAQGDPTTSDDSFESPFNISIPITEDNKQSIAGSDYSMYVGDKTPTASDFKASATDKTGEAVDVTVDFGDNDITKAGEYNVTLKSTDGQTKTVKLTVKANKQSIAGSDYSMYVGDKTPTASDFKASATDKTGEAVDVTVDFGDNDITKAGEYNVTLKSTDGQTKTVKLTVKANKQSIAGSDYSMYVGDKTPTASDFKASATDKTGASVDVTVDFGDNDITKAGEYNVTLKSTDGQTKTVKLTVKANKQSIAGSDYSMYVGDKTPTASDFKASATDKTGEAVDVTVDFGDNDITKAGEYNVTLKSTDGQTKTVKLTVKANKQSIAGSDYSMYVGDKTPTASDFKASATDKTGASVDVTVDFGDNDITKAGEYNVTLKSTDGQTKTVKLTVKANKQSIAGSDYSMYVGDKTPTASDFKASATDKTGASVDVTVDFGDNDITKAGEYNVTLKSTDGQTKTVKLTVKAKLSDTCKVMFKTGAGGTLSGTTSVDVPKGTKLSSIPKPIPNKSDVEDIYFLDWYQDGKIVNPQEVTITEDTTFTSKFGSAVYRLYNKNNGDHLLTKNKNEKNDIATAGWRVETNDSNPYGRAAFYVPVNGDTQGKKQVYRIYNPNSGEHFYSTNKAECDAAVKTGWRHETNEDYTWVSDGDVKMYREFNPDGHTAGSHNFTTNKGEHEGVVKAGWRDEAKDTSLWKALKAGF